MTQSWILIANPVAGGGRGRAVAEQATLALQATGQAVELRYTHEKGHGTKLARQAVREHTDRLIVCGGDGTIGEVLPALAGSQTALGLLPFGTANDLARALAVPRKIDAAVHCLLKGQPRPIDLGQVGNRFFATVAAFGFDAEISERMANGQVPLSGTAGYLIETWRHTARYKAPRVRLRGDFGEIEQEVLQVSIANTRSYGGGLQIAPGADPTDGLFDIVIIDNVPRWTILSVLPRLFTGQHIAHPAVRVERTAKIEIHTEHKRVVHADGEHLGESPLSIEICPKALNIVLPPV